MDTIEGRRGMLTPEELLRKVNKELNKEDLSFTLP